MKTPLTSLGTALRVLAIACVFFVAFDACFIALRPFDYIAQHYSLHGNLFPYYGRYGNQGPEFFGNMPVEFMLPSHGIARPKAADEFRVVILGDSGIAGLGTLNDNDTISQYINRIHQRTNNRQIVAYNLAIASTLLERDLLEINAALPYKPDMILWFITCQDFANDYATSITQSIFSLNKAALDSIRQKTGLSIPHNSDTWWRHSILFDRIEIKEWLQLQFNFVPAATILVTPVDLKRLTLRPVGDDLCSAQVETKSDVLLAGSKLSGAPILYINEPILVAPDYVKGASVSYNKSMSRKTYDDYRAAYASFCRKNQLRCLDIWNLVPPQEFTDSPLHRTAHGNQMIAERVLSEIDRLTNDTF